MSAPRRPWVLAVRVGVLMGLAGAIWLLGDRIEFIRGESIPYSIAWIQGGPVHKGDYVVFETQHPIINQGRPAHLTKQVVCIAGQVVQYRDDHFYCDAADLGGVLHQTYSGTPIAVAHVDGPIPDGKVFVLGQHPRSFDSRYLGLIDISRLTVVRPLL